MTQSGRAERGNGQGRRPRRTQGVVLVTAALALSACGSSGSGSGSAAAPSSTASASSGSVVLSAYHTTQAAKTAKIAMSMSVTTPGKSVSLSGSGAVDMATKQAIFTMTVPGQGTIQERVLGTSLYLSPPASAAGQLPAGKTWMLIDLAALPSSGLNGTAFANMQGNQQASNTLGMLQAVSSSGVQRVGTATIKGVATTEYRASIDLAKAAAQSTNPKLKALAAQEEQALHATTFPVTVWLDSQGRVRQEHLTISAPLPTASTSSTPTTTAATPTTTAASDTQHVTFSMTLDLSGFGSPVTVTAPPAATVDNVTAQVAAQVKAAQAQAGASTTTTTPAG